MVDAPAFASGPSSDPGFIHFDMLLRLVADLVALGAHHPGAERIITVYTATTRAREAPGVTRFTGERARQTNYATFDISLPPGRQPGKIDWPRNRPDPQRTVAVVDQHGLDEREFLARFSASARSTQGEVSLFVHGYNQNFQQALFRLAQMVGDSQQETSSILFAWPSQATVAGYVADRDAVIYLRDYLVEMLTALARIAMFLKSPFSHIRWAAC